MAYGYMININEVKDSTVAKLTNEEAQMFGLANIGFGFYKGELKTRYDGMKRYTSNDVTYRFIGTNDLTVEFTRLADAGEETYWAARIFNRAKGEYESYPMGVYGCYFLR